MIDQETIQRVVDFHGHMCPGLAMGIRVSEVALGEIGPHSQDEEVGPSWRPTCAGSTPSSS